MPELPRSGNWKRKSHSLLRERNALGNWEAVMSRWLIFGRIPKSENLPAIFSITTIVEGAIVEAVGYIPIGNQNAILVLDWYMPKLKSEIDSNKKGLVTEPRAKRACRSADAETTKTQHFDTRTMFAVQ